MLSVKGRYNGTTVILDSIPPFKECEVIVNFPEQPSELERRGITPDIPKSNKSIDDGSLAYLFKNYKDDEIREPVVDFGEPIGNERW